MPIEGLVVNASPLIVLFHSNLSEILPALCKDIMVPDAVWREIIDTDREDKAALGLNDASWAKRLRSFPIEPKIQAWDLGIGESSVLSFARKNPRYTAVLDDAAARRCARAFSIRTIGTGGLLVMAKKAGIIPSVKDSLDQIKKAGLWITSDIENILLKAAGE